MPNLDWAKFRALNGSESQNFELLCRGLMQLHFARSGDFRALSNQPGVEFHIRLTKSCSLGEPPTWLGWQCKHHTRKSNNDLTTASRNSIESSLRKTEMILPDITDWILWTPYTLSKKDQDWFYGLTTSMTLKFWAVEELDTYLSGDGLGLRSTYFGDLIATPQNLQEQHRIAVKPIEDRWLEPVHQSVEAERIVRKMLGEPGSWDNLAATGNRLMATTNEIACRTNEMPPGWEERIIPFLTVCTSFADFFLHFFDILADGDLTVIQQKLLERKAPIGIEIQSILRQLRASNFPIALEATNALDDLRIAQGLLIEIEEFLGVGLVAILADAGGGKTQIAAQLTASQGDRPAGILLHGSDLHKGQTLDDLAHHFSIDGNPLTSMEGLLASLDATGKRVRCRLPIVIDGLNEAENPKDWKSALAGLSELVKKYPNVLVVCTLRTSEHRRDSQLKLPGTRVNSRESFAKMALPVDIRMIESEGFGGDVDGAIEKYFKYYKIDPEDTEIPVEFLQNPLILRIFCEVTNPERKSEVKVNYFPASLSLLFEKFISNACERIAQMANLSHSFSAEDVELAVYHLGLELWKSKQREIPEVGYRSVISDSTRQWDSSIVNLLTQEGIIVRNPGVGMGELVITPAYDALGGYIIANALIRKHAQGMNLRWMTEPSTIDAISGDSNHELAFDIFYSLVVLAPRRLNGNQLWKIVPGLLRSNALRYSVDLEANYIDEDTIAALFALFSDNLEERNHLLPRLQRIRGVINHPFNADFLDSALRVMSIPDRDLSWTEWIRRTRFERFNDLLAMEKRWKENPDSRSESDGLRAKWVMWLLTSTDRKLRDVATRALYWFGRGDSAGLFEASISSLEINDPYVSERMLAASYGVAMARQAEIGNHDFLSKTLPNYARQLYRLMFAEKASFSTTHFLMREYAARVIEITLLHAPKLFSLNEIQRSKPPYADGGIREWGECEISEEEQSDHESPFRMDFANYTLGRLVPDRGNYDSKHEGYRKIRSQVLWRVKQLGWSGQLFGAVDSSIWNDQGSSRAESSSGKLDRYGKKYSWIAYYELAGFLHDHGSLEYGQDRFSSVDIDPSFPDRPTTKHILKLDFLGDPEMDMKEWIANGPSPIPDSVLQVNEIQRKEGPWIALDGFETQQDEVRGRKLFYFIRSFLVPNQEVDSFCDHLTRQELGSRWLPEKPEVIYTYAGEIPWCGTYPKNELSEFVFETKVETVKVWKTVEEYYLDGEKLDMPLSPFFQFCIAGDDTNVTDDKEQVRARDLEEIEIREVTVEVEEEKKEFLRFKAQIPVCDFGWEGHHTVSSDPGHTTILAKEIASRLELVGQPQTFDLFTKDGVRATYFMTDQIEGSDNHQTILFIRESILKAYLESNELSLVWAIWGEREYSDDQMEKLFHGPDHPKQPYAVFSTIRRYSCP